MVRFSSSCGTCFLMLAAMSIRVQAELPRTRQEYQAAFGKITEGMSAAKVREILGEPSDVRTRFDHGGITTSRTKEIWGYGTNGHLSFPTLGQVYIDNDRRVQYVYGGRGRPPGPHPFPEDALRSILRTIHQAPSYQDGRTGFDPLRLIQVVNALQKLGKEQALTAIDEYLRVSDPWHDGGRDGLFLVLRVLFEVPDDPGYMPRMIVGAPWPEEPGDPKVFPRFPIVLAEDIPFKLVSGYDLAGEAQPVEDHVEYFRQKGQLRAKPLRPSDRPLDALKAVEELVRSADWPGSGMGANAPASRLSSDETDRIEVLLHEQLLALLRTVYEYDPDEPLCPGDHERWTSIANELAKLSIKWDEKNVRYTFADGRSLPDPPAKDYRRSIWEPIRGFDLTLTIERQNENRVEVMYDVGLLPSGSKAATVEVYDVANQEHSLGEITLRIPDIPLSQLLKDGAPTGVKAGGGQAGGIDVQRKPGTKLKLVLVCNGEAPVSSPEFTP